VLIIQFLVSAFFIVTAGYFLVGTSERIAENTGLGQVMIGAILLSFATSLPELVTSAASVRLAAVDLGLGNILGSNMFNLSILALLDVVEGPGPLLLKLTLSHLLTGFIMILMASVAGIALTLYSFTTITPIQFRVSPESIILLALFLLGWKLIHSYEKEAEKEAEERESEQETGSPVVEIPSSAGKDVSGMSTALQFVIFGTAAIVIMLAGSSLAAAADEIAVVTGMGHSFLGTALLAAITSLPELSTTITAARRGSFDLAAGNILGSNLFNLILLVPVDLFQTGSLVAAASTINFLPLFSVIMMTVLLLTGLFYRSEHSFLHIGIAPALILFVYVVTLWLLLAL